MMNESYFDQFISNFIENFGLRNAFSCTLERQFLKKISRLTPGDVSASPRQKVIWFLVGEGAAETFGFRGTKIKTIVHGVPFTFHALHYWNLLW